MGILKTAVCWHPHLPGIPGLISAWGGCDCYCYTGSADSEIVAVLRDGELRLPHGPVHEGDTLYVLSSPLSLDAFRGRYRAFGTATTAITA